MTKKSKKIYFLVLTGLTFFCLLTSASSNKNSGDIQAGDNLKESYGVVNSSQSIESIKYKLASYAPNPACSSTGPNAIKPSDYLKNYETKPLFRPSHTLPRLSRYFMSPVSLESNYELAENWNYALAIGLANQATIDNISNSAKDAYKVIEKSKSDPRKYPLQVAIDMDIVPVDNYPDNTWLRDANGNLINGQKIFSPEAPVVFLRQTAEKRADYLRQIAEKAPISIVLNGGERDLKVSASLGLAKYDPKVVAAQGNKNFNEYIAERKAYQESLNASAARNAVPARQLYIFYFASGGLTWNYGLASQYAYNYDKTQTITDLPSDSMYFGQFNSGWTGDSNMLSQVLNSTGRNITFGQPLSYNWVNNGWWPGEGVNAGLGDHDKYLGFLKAYFTAGNIGSIAGYFDLPSTNNATNNDGIGNEGYAGMEACFDPANPFIYANRNMPQPNTVPHWLTQVIELSQVQAAFSWLEPFLRNGDLVPGTLNNYYSHDQAAYEINTGYADTRVLARKMKDSDKWIVTAWAADGVSRNVNISLDGGPNITVNAISQGHIYYVTSQNASNPVLVDIDPVNPSIGAKALWDNGTLPKI